MRVAEINMVAHGSTGKIMLNIAKCARQNEIEVRTFSARPAGKKYLKSLPKISGHTYYGDYLGNNCHMMLARIFGTYGWHSKFSTRKLIRELKIYNPEIVHLHNLHSAFINLELLFGYFKSKNIRVIWTLHDCWSFTGKCAHFDAIGCNKWENGCYRCPILSTYPSSKLDSSKRMWNKKRKTFSNVPNMTIVTPSEWLKSNVQKSFLKEYNTVVINNGIDLSVFKPTESNFKEKFACNEKFLILGVAFNWNDRKGLDVFIELSKRLDETYKIVLVGTNSSVDEKLPKNIISIHSTQNQQELVEIYSAADLFVNPTREDTYPTVNMEALACGTPVLTFRTGGSAEIINKSCGCSVDKDDVDSMIKKIHSIKEDRPYTVEKCTEHAKKYDMYARFEDYISLYRD